MKFGVIAIMGFGLSACQTTYRGRGYDGKDCRDVSYSEGGGCDAAVVGEVVSTVAEVAIPLIRELGCGYSGRYYSSNYRYHRNYRRNVYHRPPPVYQGPHQGVYRQNYCPPRQMRGYRPCPQNYRYVPSYGNNRDCPDHNNYHNRGCD